MTHFEVTNVIDRPLEEVFASVSNMETHSKWQSGVIEVKKISEGPIGVGTKYHRVDQILGRRIESEYEVIEYEPTRKFTVTSKQPFSIKLWTICERAGDGTRVNQMVDAEISGFFKLAEPLVASMAKRQFESNLSNLKELMQPHAL